MTSDSNKKPFDKTMLCFVTVEELVEELQGRFDASVFMGTKPDKFGDLSCILLRWEGGAHACIGMLYDGIRSIHRDLDDSKTPIDE